jgi:polyhydroxybutyrate depolymerase
MSMRAATAMLAPGDHDLTLRHGGRDRTWIVHVPPGAAAGAPLPVVLVFHGGGGNAHGQQAWSRLDAIADREGFLAVYPDGTGRFGRRLLTWNAGSCCGYARDNGVDDVGFVLALLDDLATRTAVDRRRVYATGMSNGAMMSYRLAAEASDRIAAVAPVAGAMVMTPPPPARSVPVMHIHSVDDPRAPYAGGPGPLFPFLRRVEHPPVERTITWWVEQDGCARTPHVEVPRRDQTGDTATRVVYAPCRDGAEVVLWKLTGAGHVWPGAPPTYARWLLGPPTRVVDASAEMWAFFRRFALPP